VTEKAADSDHVCYECMKHKICMDSACAACTDPELYCKFRPSCLIHFMEKEKKRALTKRVI
jgi:hypothetical protein